ncbi:nucleotide-binding universal stress UspA family protein [Maribacter spongiicola]|uniref:Nucleotide-binding universal stress UspA family protein n=1 Tax=Maribacter spongiicola TaxID=1206753 RepID=A0A4R7JQK3_9FLAO|nr:universal stress protein [Maribacter spongiicola]TDT40481.1 nucleotide-binding universal stress UspA family protein [Maribacter spongiicola]
MNKRILIPTDFSKNALNAIRYTIDLYAKLNCDFYLLNVFSFEKYTTNSLNIPEEGSAEFEQAKQDSEKNFVKLIDTLALHIDNPKHNYYTVSSSNFLSEAIKKLIAEKDIDLVAMGTKGATGLKGVLFGSNTVMAMEKIRECPVLAIPEHVSFMSPKEIVFPTDFKDAYKRSEFRYLIELAKMHNAEIAILHLEKNKELTETQLSNKKLLSSILSETAHQFHSLTEKNLGKGIQTFIESRESDMVSFINRKHFFFGNVFSRPLIKEIGYDSDVPILALH